MRRGLGLVFVVVCVISVSSIRAQIFFDDGDGKPAEVAGEGGHNQGNQDKENNQDNPSDYYDEIYRGHRTRDPEKFKRQEGCLCNHQLQDPHCGDDLKMYDNGCYFECAQKRNPECICKSFKG